MVDNDRPEDLENSDDAQKNEGDKPFTDDETEEAESGNQETDIADLQAKVEENYNQYMRARAELDNLRKRHQRELEQAHKYAIDKFVSELIPIKDSLEMGLQAASDEQQDAARIIEGTELTNKMFEQVFSRFNIEVVNPVGAKFDPEKHEAMSMQISPEHPANTVMHVVQKGYLLNGRIVRPAMVVVSKGGDDGSQTQSIDTQA